jgi:hypothetical protein
MDNFLRHYTEYFPNVIKRSVEIGYFKTTAEVEANFNYQNYAIQGSTGALVMGIVTTVIAMIFIRTKDEIKTNGQQRPRKIANFDVNSRLELSFRSVKNYTDKHLKP